MRGRLHRARARAASDATLIVALGVALVSLGEIRIFDRLLFVDAKEYGFVLESVRGVLAGTPVSKSWQHRLIAPYLVRCLERVASPLGALRTFTWVSLFAANFLLFALLRRQKVAPWQAFVVCAVFGFARFLCTYRLEYPWDELDILLFMLFAYGVSRNWSLVRMSPLLLVGLFNHETVLCFPAWFLLSLLERPVPPRARRELAHGAIVTATLGACIVAVRSALYVGRPALADQVFETPAPVIENHLHVVHNLRQLFVADWREGRVFVSAAFLVVVAVLIRNLARHVEVRASWWTLGFLGTVVAFGYVNETRHYLALLAFWFAYGGPRVSSDVI